MLPTGATFGFIQAWGFTVGDFAIHGVDFQSADQGRC